MRTEENQVIAFVCFSLFLQYWHIFILIALCVIFQLIHVHLSSILSNHSICPLILIRAVVGWNLSQHA